MFFLFIESSHVGDPAAQPFPWQQHGHTSDVQDSWERIPRYYGLVILVTYVLFSWDKWLTILASIPEWAPPPENACLRGYHSRDGSFIGRYVIEFFAIALINIFFTCKRWLPLWEGIPLSLMFLGFLARTLSCTCFGNWIINLVQGVIGFAIWVLLHIIDVRRLVRINAAPPHIFLFVGTIFCWLYFESYTLLMDFMAITVIVDMQCLLDVLVFEMRQFEPGPFWHLLSTAKFSLCLSILSAATTDTMHSESEHTILALLCVGYTLVGACVHMSVNHTTIQDGIQNARYQAGRFVMNRDAPVNAAISSN